MNNFKNHHFDSLKTYMDMYDNSIKEPIKFWEKCAENEISWFKKWDTVYEGDFGVGDVTWFKGAKLNVCYNCVDRHIPERGQQSALIWEGDSGNTCELTYIELLKEVSRFSNVLKSHGVSKGDRVCIYMPMIVDSIVAMLACARIGAIHTVVFGGFSAESLKDRIEDAGCSCVVTADGGFRGGKTIDLKSSVDKALLNNTSVKSVLVVHNTGNDVSWDFERDHWLHDEFLKVSEICEPVEMDAEDPLFILYTSGSTGRPKGVLHSTGGYILQTTLSFKYVFDYRENDIFWCTADIGWITGHSYMVYGPLSNGASTLIFEGLPTYPSPSRFWEVCERHNVNILYTSPTAIRMLMGYGTKYTDSFELKSLRVLGTVGEPINPEAWEWYFNEVGKRRCPIVDTWWQTETGAHLITPLPGLTELKPGSACLPFFGIEAVLVDENSGEIKGAGEGRLVIKNSWPSQIRTVYKNHDRLKDTYFSAYDGYYFTGDGARRDDDGCFWITGRVDDVINVSGHRMGTAEIESALVKHHKIAEAAVVGIPHDIKGESIFAFVSLMDDETYNEKLEEELKSLCKNEIGAIAKPQEIAVVAALPKTRSGKIMRRILRKLASRDFENIGDTTTLANPESVKVLIEMLKPLQNKLELC